MMKPALTLWQVGIILAFVAALFHPQPFLSTRNIWLNLAAGSGVLESAYPCSDRIISFADSLSGVLHIVPHSGMVLLSAIVVLVGLLVLVKLGQTLGLSDVSLFFGVIVYALVSASAWTVHPPWELVFVPAALILVWGNNQNRLPLLFILAVFWSYLSPTFVILPAILLCLVVGSYIDGDRRRLGFFVRPLLLILFVLFLPAQGWLFRNIIFEFRFASRFPGINPLWDQPDFHEHKLLACGIVLTLMALGSCFRRRTWEGTLFILGAIFLTVVSLVFQALLAAAAALTVANFFEENFTGKKSGDEGKNESRVPLISPQFIILLLLAAGSSCLLKRAIVEERLPFIYPVVSKVVENAAASKHTLHLLNDPALGGELARRGIIPFIDSRGFIWEMRTQDALLGSVAEDYAELADIRPRWEEVLKRWNFDGAILEKESSLANLLVEKEGWIAVAESTPLYIKVKGRVRDVGLVMLLRAEAG